MTLIERFDWTTFVKSRIAVRSEVVDEGESTTLHKLLVERGYENCYRMNEQLIIRRSNL